MKTMPLLKRVLVALLLILILAAAGTVAAEQVPIVFVHGNGDWASLWTTTIWRFESNGYDPDLLFAVNMAHPSAPADDTKAEENRSSTIDQAAQLASFVARTLLSTGKDKVILVGSSRGGNTIRNYVKFAGGYANTALAVSCGTPNHGVYAAPVALNSEWNGMGNFLARLNAVSEVYPNVPFMTLSSDKNDKYAQPTGEFIGRPGQPTGVDSQGPQLRDAYNIVLPGLDHRELAFHKLAFKEIFRVIAGRAPKTLDVVPEDKPVLNGTISGYANGSYTNLPLAAASVAVYAVDSDTGERQGQPLLSTITGADGLWGPLNADPTAYYEFVVNAEGYPTTRFYLPPLPRSSKYIHFRLSPLKDENNEFGAAVTLYRPRGYLGHERDTFLIDNKVPDGVNQGVPGTESATVTYPAGTSRSVKVVLNEEMVTVKINPGDRSQKIIAMFNY